MNSKALLAATAAILALSAVSCGKDDSESSVSIAYGEATNTTATVETTEKSAEKTTTEVVTTTSTTSVTQSDTVTTTETVSTTSAENTTTETSGEDTAVTTTTTSAQAETTATPETTAPDETPTENNTSAPEENNNNDTPPAITLAPDTPEPATEIRTENNTLDFKFTVDNLLNDASGLLAMLGTPDYSGEAPGCTSNGNDVKIYQYDGLEVQCYIDGSTEYIFSIEITNDKYVTDHDIKTGCTRAEVESAYGTGETSGNMTVYYTGNNEMDIEYDGDTVTSIFFYAPV